MNRGSVIIRDEDLRAMPRFNEAPIHESGKSLGRGTQDNCALRFNEAPIHESGKSYRQLQNQLSILASMRPRFMNRGSDMRTKLERYEAMQLQ